MTQAQNELWRFPGDRLPGAHNSMGEESNDTQVGGFLTGITQRNSAGAPVVSEDKKDWRDRRRERPTRPLEGAALLGAGE